MRLFLYRATESGLHRLDPRAKLAAVAGWAGVLLAFSEPVWLLAPFLALVAVAAAGRVLKPYLVGMFIIMVVGGLSFLLWPLFLTARGQGGAAAWIYGIAMGLRLSTMLLAGLLLLLVTRPEEILAAFERLGVPYPVVFSLGLTLRLVPALLASAGHVVEAQKLRGLKFDQGSPLTRARRYVPLLIPILAVTLRSATRMAWALDAKGFGSPRPRVPYLVLRMRVVDWLLVTAVTILLCAAGWARGHGWGVLPVLPG